MYYKDYYDEAKKVLEEREAEKEMLVQHLRLVIFEHEERKQAKLEELLRQVGGQPAAGVAALGASGSKAPAAGFAGFGGGA